MNTMNLKSLLYLKYLDDNYDSCWIQPLFANLRPFPSSGFMFSEEQNQIEWEETWESVGKGSSLVLTENEILLQAIYAAIFVRGRNCTLRSGDLHLALLDETLLSSEAFAYRISKKRFMIEWILDGCLGLPQTLVATEDLLEAPPRHVAVSEERILKCASNIFPQESATIGYHCGGEAGSITILQRHSRRTYTVDSLSIRISEKHASDELTTLYQSKDRDTLNNSCVFAKRLN